MFYGYLPGTAPTPLPPLIRVPPCSVVPPMRRDVSEALARLATRFVPHDESRSVAKENDAVDENGAVESTSIVAVPPPPPQAPLASFHESTALAVDCDSFDSLPDIEDILLRLATDSRGVADNFFVPSPRAARTSASAATRSSARIRARAADADLRRPHTGMFEASAVADVLALSAGKVVAAEVAVKRAADAYVAQFDRPRPLTVVRARCMTAAPHQLSAAVPAEWRGGGPLLVGKSTARGQCLFSSVGILLFGDGSDAVSLHLRALCIFELVERRWANFVEWFDSITVCDMLASLVGAAPNNSDKFGFAWPTAEVLLLLASVVQRRIVVVNAYSERLKQRGYLNVPTMFVPMYSDGDEAAWSGAEPLVIVFDGDHYKPLACEAGRAWSIDFSRLAPRLQSASPALIALLKQLQQRGHCGEIVVGCSLD